MNTSRWEGRVVLVVHWLHSLASRQGCGGARARDGNAPHQFCQGGSTFCSEGNSLCMPCLGSPCLPRSITSGTLRTLGTSHPSACLQIKLTEHNPQAGNSLLDPPSPQLSLPAHAALAKGRAAPQSLTQISTLAHPHPSPDQTSDEWAV